MNIFATQSVKNAIPNTITIISLICSCMAIILTFEGELAIAAYLLLISCACDFFDGFTARILKVKNPWVDNLIH